MAWYIPEFLSPSAPVPSILGVGCKGLRGVCSMLNGLWILVCRGPCQRLLDTYCLHFAVEISFEICYNIKNWDSEVLPSKYVRT